MGEVCTPTPPQTPTVVETFVEWLNTQWIKAFGESNDTEHNDSEDFTISF